MAMGLEFAGRLFHLLPEIAEHFGTPFHIYDEAGIRKRGEELKNLFGDFPGGFKEFFAVKALPNPAILKIMRDMGFGFDCSSIPEIVLVKRIGVFPEEIMFTSNNTDESEFQNALHCGGCIFNLDDISFIEKVLYFPMFICSFRYNPGRVRRKESGNLFIGNPEEAKYGVPGEEIVEAYRRVMHTHDVRYFGIHTMLCSNELDYRYMTGTVKMLLGVIEKISVELGIRFDFLNIGGGIGIPYKPDQKPFDMARFAEESRFLLDDFQRKFGYAPKFFMELGRWLTGPCGVLVTRVINRMKKWRQYIGVDASMSCLMRPAIYDAYHHITVLDPKGRPRQGVQEVVDVVGSLCENNDKFAKQRPLPRAEIGDLVVIHDTGAHGHAMGFNYNGRLRPKELLLREDGKVELIRRAETEEDYLRTVFDFEPDVLEL